MIYNAGLRQTMVGVAQLVEPRIVIPVVVGSSPIVHPIFLYARRWRRRRRAEPEMLRRGARSLVSGR